MASASEPQNIEMSDSMDIKSAHGEEFNHDPWAETYDQDVAQEDNPIRTGYRALLAWVLEKARIGPQDDVLDLGVGTGNLSVGVEACASLTAVDLSTNMMALARPKLAALAHVTFVCEDVLSFLARTTQTFDVLVSTYTIHHLTEPEKMTFLGLVWERLRPGGRAIFGDLMVQDEAAEQRLIQEYQGRGMGEIAEDIQEEFFWRVTPALARLHHLGFSTETIRVSDLSWGIAATKPA